MSLIEDVIMLEFVFGKRLTGKKNDLSSIRFCSDYVIENDTVNKYAKQSCCTFFNLHKKRCLL